MAPITIEQIRQVIKDENQSGVILQEVVHIKDHLEKLNGKVARHELKIFEMQTRNEVHDNQAKNDLETRVNTCPVKEGLDGRLRIIEVRDAVTIGKKQFIVFLVTFCIMILGGIATVLEINKKQANDNMETIIEEIIDKRFDDEVLKNSYTPR